MRSKRSEDPSIKKKKKGKDNINKYQQQPFLSSFSSFPLIFLHFFLYLVAQLNSVLAAQMHIKVSPFVFTKQIPTVFSHNLTKKKPHRTN